MKKVLLLIILILLVEAGVYVWMTKRPMAPQPSVPQAETTSASLIGSKNYKPEDIIATVGKETIYRKDYLSELPSYPAGIDNLEKIIMDKLVRDSVILQGGASENIIALTPDIYNSLNKNYVERIDAVKKVETEMEKTVNHISGSLVSLWFVSSGKIGPLGYEKAKQTAFDKISALHTAVKAGRLTMEQAGERLKADTTLAQIDPQYVPNAYHAFTSYKEGNTNKISVYPAFDAIMWNLNEREVSDIYTGQDYADDLGKQVDAIYMFGQVESKKLSGQYPTFEKWLIAQYEKYPVT